MSGLKKGRISKKEDQFIQDNLETMSAAEIAENLNRNPVSIEEYIKKKFNIGATSEEVAEYDLRDRPFYLELRLQFDQDELELFNYHWKRLIGQFNNDVFPTEEMQIVDVIRLSLLMNRCLKTNKDNMRAVERIEREIEREFDLGEDKDLDTILNLERQVGALRASQEALNKDYRDLQSKKSSMLREMKGTREQRVKRLEDSKESFGSWVAALMQNPERLKAYGLQMEKLRLSMEKEKRRLSQFHKYEDGMVDQPFLNHESVFEDESEADDGLQDPV